MLITELHWKIQELSVPSSPKLLQIDGKAYLKGGKKKPAQNICSGDVPKSLKGKRKSMTFVNSFTMWSRPQGI